MNTQKRFMELLKAMMDAEQLLDERKAEVTGMLRDVPNGYIAIDWAAIRRDFRHGHMRKMP